MVNCGDLFKQVMSDTFRDQGHLRFDIIEDNGVADYSIMKDPSADVRYHSAPIYDKNTRGDDIATGELRRWVLDGTMHSKHVNNRATSIEHNIVSDSLGSLGVFKEVDIHLIFKNKNYPITDRITLIWDPVLKQAPINYMIEYVYYDVNEYQNFLEGKINNITGKTGYVTGPTDLYAYKYTLKLPNNKKVAIESIRIMPRSSTEQFKWSSTSNRFRLAEIILGDYYNEESEDINLTNCKVTKEVSVLNNSKPTYTTELTFDNTSKIFDPLQKEGIITKLQKGMLIPLQWGISLTDSTAQDILWATPEKWLVNSWECPSNSNEFKLVLNALPDYFDFIYYPESFIFHTDEDPEWDDKRTPGKSYTIESWLDDIFDYYRIYNKITKTTRDTYGYDPQNAYVLNSVEGWPLIESNYTLFQKFAQCLCAYISIDLELGQLKFSSIPTFNSAPSRVIKESEIIESPSISENINEIKEILYNLYLMSLTNFTVDISKSIDISDISKTLIMPFGTTKITETIKVDTDHTVTKTFEGNVLGLPETYSEAHVSVTDFTYYGREAHFIVNSASEDAVISSTVDNATIEQVVQYLYKIRDTGNALTIDNNFINNSWAIFNLINHLLPIINSKKAISIKTIGEVDIEPGDYIRVETEYGNFNVLVLKTSIDFNGGFSGTIEGRIINYGSDVDN